MRTLRGAAAALSSSCAFTASSRTKRRASDRCAQRSRSDRNSTGTLASRVKYSRAPRSLVPMQITWRTPRCSSLSRITKASMASEAMLAFVIRDSELHRGVRQVICIGTSDRGAREYFTREASVPVEFLSDLERCAHLSDALLFVRDDAVKAQELDSAAAAPRNVRIVRERDLAARFGL